MTQTNVLPESAIEWIPFLQAQLHVCPHEHEEKISRALFQLLLTGSFHGKDLWVRQMYESNSPLPDTNLPRFLKNVRVSFGMDEKRTANLEERIIMLECLASISKRNIRMIELVNDDDEKEYKEILFLFDEKQDKKNEAVGIELAKKYLEGSILFTGFQSHQFLIIWSYWRMVHHEEHTFILHPKLVDFENIFKNKNVATLSEFIYQAP